MTSPLNGRHIVLGVTGSIGAFKAVTVASELVKRGAQVDVVMTDAATKFVTPLSFRAMTHRPVIMSLWADDAELEIGHVTRGRRADLLVIVPATADIIARLAHGLADDVLTTTYLATTAPVLIAPAMEPNMWAHPATQSNVAELRRHGVRFIGPLEGRMASGQIGMGRMAEPGDVIDAMEQLLRARTDLDSRHIVVTAGGTQEPIDPVRFIGNRSSGKMGFAIAEAARDRGARVTVIAGATQGVPPIGVDFVRIQSTRDLEFQIHAVIQDADALVMAAAPADFRVENAPDRKIKRGAGTLSLSLIPNPDILAGLADWHGVKIGFAAETNDLILHAQAKVRSKSVAMIVANDVTIEGSGFGTDTNQVTFVFDDGRIQPFPLLTKREVADHILDVVVERLAAKRQSSTTISS